MAAGKGESATQRQRDRHTQVEHTHTNTHTHSLSLSHTHTVGKLLFLAEEDFLGQVDFAVVVFAVEGLAHYPLLDVALLGALVDHLVLRVEVHHDVHECLFDSKCTCIVRERGGERQRYRDRERQRDIDTERQRDRERDRDRETERQRDRDRETERQRQRQRDRDRRHMKKGREKSE